MIQPKEITIADQDGKPRSYIISKFPAIEGREIVAKYPISALPKLGDYAVSEETMLKLMGFVAVDNNGTPLCLTTRALVNNHVPDFETLAKLELAMIDYNCSFFRNGTLSDFLQGVVRQVLAKISEMSTTSSAQSSPAASQVTTN